MPSHSESLRASLYEIERIMRELQYGAGAPPEASAFNSTLPFFADTMRFESWLQWVLLPRFHASLDGLLPLPANCSIAPMAEEAFKQEAARLQPLIQALRELDQHFSNPEQPL